MNAMATMEDFNKLDLRVGKIVDAMPVSGSDRLLSISVDIGEARPRTIVSGVATVYKLDYLIGKNVIVVANLDSKIFMGAESQGMLIGIEEDASGMPVLIFAQQDIAPGSKLS